MSLFRGMVACGLVVGVFGPCMLAAQTNAVSASETHASDAAQEAPKTLKERLGDKASDEQRVNNCKVPAQLRGAKARPEGCADLP